MNDKDIAQRIAVQIIAACVASLGRFKEAKTEEEKQMTAVTEFLSGITQTADFIKSNKGTITAQHIEDALKIVDKELGLYPVNTNDINN